MLAQDLVKGKLDQKNAVFRVTGFMARDVRREDIRGMIEKLTAWYVQVHISEMCKY
jgi:hypothetical protein